MRACVISGGGSLGAFGAGTLAALNQRYEIVTGVSTGALMAPLVAINGYNILKEAYTSVTQDSIFSYNPFLKNGKANVVKVVWRLLQGKATVGETHNLRKLLDKFLSDEDIFKIKFLRKHVIVACQQTNVEPGKICYFDILTETGEDFKDWMWASANAPLVTSILYKNGGEWTDGGVTELVSLKKVLQMGAKEVDVIIHRQRPQEKYLPEVTDVFHNAARLFKITRQDTEKDDLEDGLDFAKFYGAKVNVYWLPRKLTSNSLIFDKAQMLEWWNEGFETAFNPARIDNYDYTKRKVA